MNVYLVETFSGDGITFESYPLHIASTLDKAKEFIENYENTKLTFSSFNSGQWHTKVSHEVSISIRLVEIDGKIGANSIK